MENSGIWRQGLSMLLLLQGLSSGAQSCPTIHNPVDCSTSGFPIYHQLPEPAQTHVHWANHRILCRPLLVLPSIFPSIKIFSNESALFIRWPKYWSFSFSISLPVNIQDDSLLQGRQRKTETHLELTVVSVFGSKSTGLFAAPRLCLLSLVLFFFSSLHLCSTSASSVSAVSASLYHFLSLPLHWNFFLLTDWSFNSSCITHVAISAINLEKGKKNISSLCATVIQIWWTNLFSKT